MDKIALSQAMLGMAAVLAALGLWERRPGDILKGLGWVIFALSARGLMPTPALTGAAYAAAAALLVSGFKLGGTSLRRRAA